MSRSDPEPTSEDLTVHLADRLEVWKLDRLRPYLRNSRTHPEEQLARLERSIRELGFNAPILVGTDDGIIAGHARATAAERLGLSEVPVVVLDHLSDAERRAYVIADNRIAELGGWDLEALEAELAELEGEIELETLGFDQDEVDALLAEAAGSLEDPTAPAPVARAPREEVAGEDEVPEVAAPRVELGDVWNLGRHRLEVRDALEVLGELEEDSVDTVLTDPPYGLGFMGKGWDRVLPDRRVWTEAFRVAKPGALLLAFGGTRTFHRLAVDLEDAGFEVRDVLSWLYGTGFPKGLAVDAAIDRRRHDRKQVLEVTSWIRETRDAAGRTNAEIDDAFGFSGMAGHWTTSKSQPAVPTIEQVPDLLEFLGVDDPPERIRELLLDLNGAKGQPGPAWWKRPVVGTRKAGISVPGESGRHTVGGSRAVEVDVTLPATEESEPWHGWRTELKPAWEPVVLTMKPTRGTFAENALAYGVAGFNVAGAAIPHGEEVDLERLQRSQVAQPGHTVTMNVPGFETPLFKPEGRYPANVVLDEVAAEELEGAAAGASRFFYTSKASRAERGEGNLHPTVKPLALMRWLARLTATPTGGVVLEPFAGSGTTILACELEGRTAIACELDPASAETSIIRWERLTGEVATRADGATLSSLEVAS